MRAGPRACRLGPAGRKDSIMARYYEINYGVRDLTKAMRDCEDRNRERGRL